MEVLKSVFYLPAGHRIVQNATTKHKASCSWSVLLSRAQTGVMRYADGLPRLSIQFENKSVTGEWLERYTNPVYQTDTSRGLYNA